jgi:hypothetical protein
VDAGRISKITNFHYEKGKTHEFDGRALMKAFDINKGNIPLKST